MKLRILLPPAATLASPTGYNCKHTCFLSKQNIVERKKNRQKHFLRNKYIPNTFRE